MLLTFIAKELDATIVGESNLNIDMIGSYDNPKKNYIAYAENTKIFKDLLESDISAIIISEEFPIPNTNKPLLRVKNGKLAFIKALQLFHETKLPQECIHSTAMINPTVKLGKEIEIMAYVVIEEGSIIEDQVIIYPFTYIGKNCHIKKQSIIHSNVSIHSNTIIGKNNIIHSGVVLGADGFGFYDDDKIRYKIPQLGIVETESHVEIGANTTIDRATLGKTLIGSGTKIDNLVQIAHNCKIGRNCFITSQAGIAGSSRLGDRVVLAGQAGVSDHIVIGDDVLVLAQSCVTKDIPGGKVVLGFPAKDALTSKKEIALLSRLNKKQK